MRKSLLVLFGLLVGVAIVEVIARVGYRKPWYTRLLDAQVNRTIHYRKNAMGLRDRDYGPKPSRCKRLLILGDSFSYGAGVEDENAPFPRLLERQLNQELGCVEVLNGGIPGSLTKDWLDLLRRTGSSFRPDVVLVVFFLRDGTHIGSIGAFFDPIRNELKATAHDNSWAYKHSYAFRLYRDTLNRRRLSEKYAKAMNESFFGSAAQTEEWRNAQANLLAIKQESERDGARTGLVVFPILVELNRSYPFRRIYDLVEGFGRRIGYPTFGLLPAFTGQSAPDLWVSPYDQHPNARAHAIVANALLPFVRQLMQAVDERSSRVTADDDKGRGGEQHKKNRDDPPALVASHLADEFSEKTQAVPAVIRANPRG